MYTIKFYSGSNSFYQYSEVEMLDICNSKTGFIPAIIKDNLIVAIQPWNPQDDSAWKTKTLATAWANAWIDSMSSEFLAVEKTRPIIEDMVPPSPEFAN